MKTVKPLFILVLFLYACSSPKKTPAEKSLPPVTRADVLRGGTSFSNAVVIGVKTEREGRDEEYRWLSNIYPGYTLIRKTPAKKGARHFDIIRIKTKEGRLKDIYFDITSFSAR